MDFIIFTLILLEFSEIHFAKSIQSCKDLTIRWRGSTNAWTDMLWAYIGCCNGFLKTHVHTL
jgi:hypothetical protein